MIMILNLNQFINENNNLNILYHGSKYLFDKFDISRINTGQHSQDFGYGLYFTSNKETATFYANELSNIKTPIEKYNSIIIKNDMNKLLYNYLNDNKLITAKRLILDLINRNIGYIDEWKELLENLDTVQRYGYVYTVSISDANFIDRDEYLKLKNQLNIGDREMNKILLEKGFNGIKYKINSFGLNKTTIFDKEYNVVLIDDNNIKILDVEKVEFNGTLKLNNF